jgi:hypothetical protein
MPFDPTLPADHAELRAAVMRGQLTALFGEIQAIPAGPPGPPGPPGAAGAAGPAGGEGPPGPPFAEAVVDGVNTLEPGADATVAVSFAGGEVHFTFGIPRGAAGADGTDGTDGAPGPPGPPFAQAVVDGVSTLDPGQNATVETSFDGTFVHFTFGIPRGFDGATGGSGPEGPAGPAGPPGEVTAGQLAAAIAATARDPGEISPLSVAISDPPTQAEVQAVVDWLGPLLAALQR